MLAHTYRASALCQAHCLAARDRAMNKADRRLATLALGLVGERDNKQTRKLCAVLKDD